MFTLIFLWFHTSLLFPNAKMMPVPSKEMISILNVLLVVITHVKLDPLLSILPHFLLEISLLPSLHPPHSRKIFADNLSFLFPWGLSYLQENLQSENPPFILVVSGAFLSWARTTTWWLIPTCHVAFIIDDIGTTRESKSPHKNSL